jgi:hypothetical protein
MMNKKQATASSMAIVGMALLATITMVSPTQALPSLDDEVFDECLEELGDSPDEEEGEQVRSCFLLGYDLVEDSDTPNEGADEDDEDDTNVD